MSNTPAGWYPQGDGQQQRYWDGEKWTEHFAPMAVQSATSTSTSSPDESPGSEELGVTEGDAVASSTPKPDASRPWFKKKRFVIPAGVVGLLILVSAIGAGGDDTTSVAASETSTAATPTTEPIEESESATPTPTPSQSAAVATTAPAPIPEPVSFDGSGIYEVGSDVKPGLYRSEGGGYWERLKDASGDFEAILANANPTGQSYVQIKKSDGYFSTSGNGEWVLVDSKAKGEQATSFSGDGMFMVGVDIKAGTYKASGSGYWERLRGAGGDFDDIIANDNPTGNAIVNIKKTDKFFETNGMEEWTRTK